MPETVLQTQTLPIARQRKCPGITFPNRPHASQAWGNFAEPLSIAVSANTDGPTWKVHYPNPGEGRGNPPSETYTTRDALIAELGRLEQLGHQRLKV
ncbi:hypothetical protein R1CP_40450 (plasmid) [Rhodococcus opacus]|uniref:Uncharacterized protein n=1 Tax=Rhodococcus opacus TaxID=37919 RepID=A0A1B1KJ86_RHOOP|nr:hypothetical protein R1CP_40450 [Rhodococcus opacus]